jgi:two-component system response regulator WspF
MRIGIVNDSAMAREALRRVVASWPGLEVAWTAVDGADGVAKARANPPDLVLMDLFMPGMDGVESTRRIMIEAPCPILIVTASVSGQIDKVYQAMGFGALDAVDTPVIGKAGDMAGGEPLLRKIEVIGKLTGKYQAPPAPAVAAPRIGVSTREPLLLIGASTGGPFAVAEVLTALPSSWSVCTIVVQHVDADFAPGLGGWLAEHTGKPVELIAEGTRPAPGRFLLSATGDHLVLADDRRLVYSDEPREVSYRPSIDVFFASVARCWPGAGAAVLLTGMGRDGAEGLLALRRRGWRTIAQDEATSVVWGMPRSAVEIGAAELVAPLDRIAAAIVERIPDPRAAKAQTPAPPR